MLKKERKKERKKEKNELKNGRKRVQDWMEGRDKLR